jgi:histidine triad (HIT) family protein
MTDCIFCNIIARTAPAHIIAETDDILVIQDVAPKARVHYLIIPKKHIKDLNAFGPGDCCLMGKMVKMAQKLSQETPGAQDFKFIINNGYAAGQRVFHVHAHFIAGERLAEF